MIDSGFNHLPSVFAGRDIDQEGKTDRNNSTDQAGTGLIGAIVSVGFAFLIDVATSEYARQVIETRIDQSFDFRVFVYSTGDILIISSIAIGVSMLSSLLPSRRAARLDPVVAMK